MRDLRSDRIQMGQRCLVIRDSATLSSKNYCIRCGQAILDKARDDLAVLEAELLAYTTVYATSLSREGSDDTCPDVRVVIATGGFGARWRRSLIRGGCDPWDNLVHRVMNELLAEFCQYVLFLIIER